MFVKWRSERRVFLSSDAGAPIFVPLDGGPEQLRRLTEISRALTYTTSLDEVTRLTVQRGAQLLDASAAVLMLSQEDGLLRVRAAWGVESSRVAEFSAQLSEDLVERLQALFAVGPECCLAVPLVVRGEVTGIVAVAKRTATTDADEWLLSALADHTAVAVENARLGGEVRLEMEQRLLASEDASDARDRALSTLAHDIRTPLGAIEGYCGILEAEIHGPINDRQRETLGRVRMSGRHLLSLLDNVMDMARIGAGVLRLEVESVRLVDGARDAIQMLIPAAEAKLQKVELDVVDDAVARADPARLRQVLVNLIGNAVKFTPPEGSISVHVSNAADDDVQHSEIRVTDTGPGVPAAEHAAIFAPYYRSATAASSPGVGLGLAISHALVEQMGGSLRLESEAGDGCTFIVRLPPG